MTMASLHVCPHLFDLTYCYWTGVEDLFLHITTRLVDRKVQIERDRVERSRNSVLLTAPADDADKSPAGYGCC